MTDLRPKRLRECLAACERRLREQPRDCSALQSRASLRLLLGDCGGGWRDLMAAYEHGQRLMASYAEGDEGLESRSQGWPGGFGISADVLSEKLDGIVKNRPRLAEAWAWRGALRRRMLRYEEAVFDLERACRLGLHSAAVLTWKGEARLQTGDTGGMEDLEAALRLPCQAWNYAWTGRSKLAFGRGTDCLAYLDRAIELDPDNGWHRAWRGEAKRLLRRPTGMLRDFDEALRRDPGLRYEPYVRTWRGLALAQLGRHREALRDFDRALRLMPDYAPAVNGRARSNRALRRLTRWFADFERAAKLDAKYVQAQYSLPREDMLALERDLGRLLRARPGLPGAWLWRGIQRGLLTRFKAAERDLSRAAALAPRDPRVAAWRGELRRAAGDPQGAMDELDRAVRLSPENVLARSRRANILAEAGRLREALADLDAALEGELRFSWLFADRGRLRLMSGDPAGAARDFRKAVSLDPKHAGAKVDLALALGRGGDRAGERRLLEAALSAEGNVAGRRLRLWAAFWSERGGSLTAGHREALELLPSDAAAMGNSR